MPTSAKRTARYEKRPPASCRSARIAWDVLSSRAALMKPSRVIATLWFAPDMEAWNARLNEIEGPDESPYIEIDMLVVRDRLNNPHKFAAIVASQSSQPKSDESK